MTQKLISQGTLKIDFLVNNRPKFALMMSKEAPALKNRFSQGNLETNFRVNSWPIFAQNVSKEALTKGSDIKVIVLKIKLLPCNSIWQNSSKSHISAKWTALNFTALCIHNIDPIYAHDNSSWCKWH